MIGFAVDRGIASAWAESVLLEVAATDDYSDYTYPWKNVLELLRAFCCSLRIFAASQTERFRCMGPTCRPEWCVDDVFQ